MGDGRKRRTRCFNRSYREKYNNMVKKNVWDQKCPKDTKFLALTTKLEVLESAFNNASKTPYKGGTEGGGGSHNKNKGPFIMPD